ncbi:MAG: sialate O-acetylesterase [Planctomycetes bacterium]|nr:sialate O-acetylesterase [Planctomycetota bacterium]
MALGFVLAVRGEVKLHGLFTGGMVIQRDIAVAVYGTAGEGERVTVTCAGQTHSTVAQGGQWQVTLDPLSAGGPHELTVSGANRVVLEDVLVGDVWLCTGQSNMAGILRSYKSAQYSDYESLYADLPGGKTFPRIRLFKVARGATDESISEIETDEEFGSSWRVCDPEAALLFSTTGYLFGRELRKHITVPIGLIYSTVGGTAAESWVSRAVLTSRPELKEILDRHALVLEKYPQAEIAYKERLANWQVKRKSGEKVGRWPKPPMSSTQLKRPSGLYNKMIAPLQRYAIKGVIWYQGESNAGRPEQYATLFPALITAWRRQWGKGDFPFLFVQLAAFRKAQLVPNDGQWPWLREAQTKALALPNTGMAVAIDAGHQTNIHPPFKQLVAKRLVFAALNVAYGRDVPWRSPTFSRLTVQGAKAAVHFDNAGGGLEARAVELDGHQLSADELKGALKLLKAIGEDLPTDVLKAIGAMGAAAALAVEKAAETTGDEPAGEEEETTSITFDELMEKAGSKFSKETKSALDTVLEEIKSAHKDLAALLKNAKVGKAEGETTEEVPGGAEEKKFTQAEVDAIVADKVSAAETVAAQEAADLATEETLAAIG